jgi:hypothetical protein
VGLRETERGIEKAKTNGWTRQAEINETDTKQFDQRSGESRHFSLIN